MQVNKCALITVIVFVIVISFAVILSNSSDNDSGICTAEAKLCPDGSSVARNASNNCEFDSCPSNSNRYCAPESRNADACIELYQPVCGWNNPDKIQCIKYPCAQTYSNSCFACQNENVLYWTKGECPQ